jgi:hypothetical protein
MTKLAESMLNSFLKGFTLDAQKKLKVLDEGEAKKAVDSLSKMILEKSREYWDMLESAEGSLANLRDQISFEELNADPSSLVTDAPMGDAVSATGDAAAAAAGAPADMNSLLGEAEDFDLGSIFEMAPMHQAPMMDAEGQDDVVDGDQDFQDMRIGADDAGMGGDAMSGDEGDLDNLDPDAVGGDDMGDMGDEGFDPMATDDMGGDELASDDMGGDEVSLNPEDSDFDFDLFGDEEVAPEGDLGGDVPAEGEDEVKDESLGAY